jgi:uncharacterized membrane protein
VKIAVVLTVLGALVSLGGSVSRWEGIVWPAVTIVWALCALVFAREADR